MAKSARRRRWRWLIWPVLLVGGFFALRALLEPERLSAFVLERARLATGLDIALAQPADIGFWPGPRLRLQGLTATAPGATTPVLRADEVDVALPWSTLWSDSVRIGSLHLQAPQLDLAALSQWNASRVDAGPPAPIRLPELSAALTVEDGRIVGEASAISKLELELPALRDGQATTLNLAGEIERAGKPVQPFDLRLAFTPRQTGDELRLEPLTIAAHDSDGEWLTLSGKLALRGSQDLSFALSGTLPQWPSTWPALPLPATREEAPIVLELGFEGATDLQGALTLRLARDDEGVSGHLQLGEVLAWSGDPRATPLPPLSGELSAPRLQFGSVELRGVRIKVIEAQPSKLGAMDAKAIARDE